MINVEVVKLTKRGILVFFNPGAYVYNYGCVNEVDHLQQLLHGESGYNIILRGQFFNQ